MICSECGKTASVLAQGLCLSCNDKANTANYDQVDASDGGGKLLAFFENLCKTKSNGVITMPSGKRLTVMPQRD